MGDGRTTNKGERREAPPWGAFPPPLVWCCCVPPFSGWWGFPPSKSILHWFSFSNKKIQFNDPVTMKTTQIAREGNGSANHKRRGKERHQPKGGGENAAPPTREVGGSTTTQKKGGREQHLPRRAAFPLVPPSSRWCCFSPFLPSGWCRFPLPPPLCALSRPLFEWVL